MERINCQNINGYLWVDYYKDDFIEITDMNTRNKIRFHNLVIQVINKTIKDNNRKSKK